MKNLLSPKFVVGIGFVVLAGGLYMSGALNGIMGGGIDVSGTACEDISATRLRVATELGERKTSAQEVLDTMKNKIADNYYAKHQALQEEYYRCSSRALTSDPCKEASDRITALYHEIMADFDAGKGFNEAKFNEREEAKKEYNECVKNTHKPEFYKEKQDQCDAAFAAGREANLAERNAAEAAAKTGYGKAVADAEKAHDEKQATLDAIEKKCNEPGQTSHVLVGPLTTEGSGAAVQPNSAICTGAYAGNDPEIQRQINRLESQLQKAKAGGQTGGLFGTDHIQQALDRLREELRNTPRTCKVDSDCGSTVPVCCSATEVGRARCSAGVCTTERTTCEHPSICAGKPAQCIAAYQGGQQQDGIYISRTIPEVGSCSQNLQVVNLGQSSPEAVRYSLNGSIPAWLHIDKPGGKLPGAINVTYSCNTVQKMGPGTYTVNASVTVYNAANELINTIPFNVSITVTPAPVEMIDAIAYNGKYLPLSQLIIEDEVGCGADHYHAAQGVVKATDGSQIPDPGPQCGYGKVRERPTVKVPAVAKPAGNIEVRGLEGLKTQ